MQVSPFDHKISAANLPLEKLAGSTQVDQPEKIAEISRQFEAVLLRQILSQAQKPLFQSNVGAGGGASNAIYQDLSTEQLANHISHGGSFGFAKVLEKQLDGQFLRKDAKTPLKPFAMNAAQRFTPEYANALRASKESAAHTASSVSPGRPAGVSTSHPATKNHLHAQPGKSL